MSSAETSDPYEAEPSGCEQFGERVRQFFADFPSSSDEEVSWVESHVVCCTDCNVIVFYHEPDLIQDISDAENAALMSWIEKRGNINREDCPAASDLSVALKSWKVRDHIKSCLACTTEMRVFSQTGTFPQHYRLP